jgi:hypothetical protein
MYYRGEGVPRNYPQAYQWFKKSADKGDARGENLLGILYEYGQGVTQNNQQALSWYQKSAEQDNSDGRVNLQALRQKTGSKP